MSAEPIEAVLERLANRAREDGALAETLAFLAQDEVDVDPFARPSDAVVAAARRVNVRRSSARRRALMANALTTTQVVELIGSISDRRAVDRRRRRGRLLGVKVGNTMWHPAWQFDRRSGDTRRGLPRILEALTEVTDDPVAADALMTTPHPQLEGRAIADVFADADLDLAVTLIRLAGDQS
jgi:hypothetical protein